MKNNYVIDLRKRKGNPRFILSFLAFLMFSSPVYAQECGYFGTYLQNGVCVPDVLINTATVVMLVSLSIASLFLMLGIALQHTRIINWSKDLLFQLLGSAVILMVYLGMVASLNYWAPILLGTNLAYPTENTVRNIAPGAGWTTLQENAQQYVSCLLNYGKESLKQILEITSFLSVLGTASMSINVGSFSQFIPIFPTGGGFISLFSMVMGIFAMIVIQLSVQLYILELWIPLFNLVLPLGLIFRSFPYTRGAGAAMIAIAIGFTILLPIFYLLIQDIGHHFTNISVCTAKPEFEKMSGFFRLIKFGINAFSDISGVIERTFSLNGSLGKTITVLLVEATILPFVGYLVVLNITKQIAEALGGEIDFSTLVRFI